MQFFCSCTSNFLCFFVSFLFIFRCTECQFDLVFRCTKTLYITLMNDQQIVHKKKIKKKDQQTTEKKKKKIDILGLSNNRKLQQTKEKERQVAAASLCRGRAISARMIAIFFLRLNEKKGLILKGYFRDFNKNFIKPKSIPSHFSQF